MSVIQVMNSRPGWGRPAVKRAAPRPAPTGHRPRHRQRPAMAAWARLWGPELIVAEGAVCWLAVRLHPTPTVPVPAEVTWLSAPAWWRWLTTMAWPSQGAAVAQVRSWAVVFVVVVVADMVWQRDRRICRRLRWRWVHASRRSTNEAPRLRNIRRHGGVIDATVVLRSKNWDDLEAELHPDKGSMLRNLKLGNRLTPRSRRLGSPVRARILSTGDNTARTRSLTLYYKPLPLPDAFPAYEKPAKGAKVFVGHSVDGSVTVDLDEVPHVQVVGDTGSGKGQFIQLTEIQVLRAGWLGIVLDGGGSPEHAIIDPAPTFLRPMRIEMTAEARLVAAITAVKLLKALADARSAVAEAFGVTRWADLPADVRAWLPRIWMVVDETTKLLAPSKDAKLDALRKQLATMLDTDGLRNGRKFGIHILLSDQFAYSVVFSRGAQRQAANVVVLGNMAPEQVRQVTGLASLPPVPEVPRCGHFVRFGNPRIREIRVPFHPQALRRAVEYVVDQTGGSS